MRYLFIIIIFLLNIQPTFANSKLLDIQTIIEFAIEGFLSQLNNFLTEKTTQHNTGLYK